MSILDDIAASLSDRTEAEPKIAGVMIGKVTDLEDPLLLGRVRVQLPAIDGMDSSPWARVATPAASLASGFYWIPGVEDEVLVAFEQGDLHAPYIIGALWSAVAPPPLPSPLGQIRMIRTPQGNQIIFTEDPPSITIITASMDQSIVMNDAGIQMFAGGSTIIMTPAGITITGTTINLVGENITVSAATSASLVGEATTSVGSPASPCVISGLPVQIN